MRHALLALVLALPVLGSAQAPAPPPGDPVRPRDPGEAQPAPEEEPGPRSRIRRNAQRLGLPTQSPTGQVPPPSASVPVPIPANPSPPRPVAAAPSPGARTPTAAPQGLRPAEAACKPLAGRVMLNFDKTDIVDVLQQASRWTCRNFIYTDDIARGKITLLSMTPVTAQEAYAAFLAALASNNIALYQTGKYHKLVRAADARKTPIPMLDGSDGTPATEQPVTKIFRLSYSDSDQLRGILGNFTSPQGADVQSIPPDVLIVTDIGVNIRRIEKLIETIDRAGAGDAVRLIQIRFAAAKDIADKVNQVFQTQGGAPGRPSRRTVVSGGTPAAPVPPGVAPPAPGGAPTQVSVTKVLSDDRTNKLIVIADEKSFQRIEELIAQLDVPTSAEGGIHVVFLKYANAEEMAQTLSNLAQGTSGQRRQGNAAPGNVPQIAGMPQPPTQPAAVTRPGDVTASLFSGDVKVTGDKAQNALLVQASGADFIAMSRLIDKLDRPRRQVFVEAVLMEVNLRNENQFGISGHGFIPFDYNGKTGVIPIASQPSVGRFNSFNLASLVSLGGFLTGMTGPTSAELKALGLNLPSIGLVVQALQSNSDVNVLSTPHLVATDNEESEIAVGNNVPFQAGIVPVGIQQALAGSPEGAAASALGLGGVASNIAPIQRQNVELRLKIKPQISEGGSVRLTIDEQVEEIVSQDSQLGPTTAKRSVKTQIVAKDMSTIVIGGLIQDRSVKSVKQLPILGSIPIIGWLFRDTVSVKQRTNLLLFLTPYIIRDENDYRRIYEKKRKEQQEFVEQFYGRQPQYMVDVDWARKAGPYARLRAGVAQEQSRLENGGPGAPGEGQTGLPREPVPVPLPGTRPSRPDAALPPDHDQPVPAEPAPTPPPTGPQGGVPTPNPGGDPLNPDQ